MAIVTSCMTVLLRSFVQQVMHNHPLEEGTVHAQSLASKRPIALPKSLPECIWKVQCSGAFSARSENPTFYRDQAALALYNAQLYRCPCIIDGVDGPLCESQTEQFCVNQCSGHGECERGWCRCQPGYYGQDCAKLTQGSPPLPGRNLVPSIARLCFPDAKVQMYLVYLKY